MFAVCLGSFLRSSAVAGRRRAQPGASERCSKSGAADCLTEAIALVALIVAFIILFVG